LISVDGINAFQHPSTFVVNGAQRASTLHVNGFQQKSTSVKTTLPQSGCIAA